MTPEEIVLAIQLAQQVIALISGTKSAAEVATELQQGITNNNAWLVAHGLPPVTRA